jgi:type II secretory pathway pseudopilin PulG
MNHQKWREIVEVLCVVSVVAVLLIIALELREANRNAMRIAEAEIQLQLRDQLAAIDQARSRDDDVARLYAKLAAPKSHLITATEKSQMEALAEQYVNFFTTAQIAYEKGLLPAVELERLERILDDRLRRYPGLEARIVDAWERTGHQESEAVFAPIAQLAAEGETEDE